MSTKKYYYVYRISDIVENKHYYGKRSCSVEPELDLGIKYFSSSKDKEFIKDQKENPSKYEYIIIARCDNDEEALDIEIYLHNYYNVGVNNRFYNKAKQTTSAFSFDATGASRPKTQEHRDKISKALTGNRLSDETKAKLSAAKKGKKPNNYGKPRSAEAKAKASIAMKGRKISEELKQKLSTIHSKLANVYNYLTDELIASNVVVTHWCKDKKYTQGKLCMTAKADRSKPSSSKNPHHHKQLYIKYVGE